MPSELKNIFSGILKKIVAVFGIIYFSSAHAFYSSNTKDSEAFLADRYYVGSCLEIGEQELDLRQESGDDIERVTTERQRILLGFVGPEGVRLEISRWYQQNSDITQLTTFTDSRGFDGKLIIQEMIGPVMTYLSLGGGVFKYDEPIILQDNIEKSLSGTQYGIGIGAHWLAVSWLELSAGFGYQWQEDDRDNGFEFRGESQTLDLGLHLVF